MSESQDSQLLRLIALAHKAPNGDEWVRELGGVETQVIAMAIGDLTASRDPRSDPVRLREAALAVVQERAIRQQAEMTAELRTLISTTERLERSATRLQWTAIVVGAVVSFIGIFWR